jgi:hypothetical protein
MVTFHASGVLNAGKLEVQAVSLTELNATHIDKLVQALEPQTVAVIAVRP